MSYHKEQCRNWVPVGRTKAELGRVVSWGHTVWPSLAWLEFLKLSTPSNLEVHPTDAQMAPGQQRTVCIPCPHLLGSSFTHHFFRASYPKWCLVLHLSHPHSDLPTCLWLPYLIPCWGSLGSGVPTALQKSNKLCLSQSPPHPHKFLQLHRLPRSGGGV